MKICLLGIDDSSYTKMICSEFNKQKIRYDLILVEKRTETRAARVLLVPYKLYVIATEGRFKGLNKFRIFFATEYIKTLWRSLFPKAYYFEKEYNTLSFTDVVRGASSVYFTPSINHVKTFSILNNANYDIGVLAGVGIVSEPILNSFEQYCLNAHPAPLPFCKGGGALENTLNKNLTPAVSVHKAVRDIDGGEILDIVNLKLSKNDSFDSVYRKLTILCCITMAKNVRSLVSGERPTFSENIGGKLHYWAECNEHIQRNARRNLKKMLADL